MSGPHLPPVPPTPPAFEQKWADVVEARAAQLSRDVIRLILVANRTEDRLAIIAGRVSKLEELLAGMAKLQLAIAEKLGVTS